MKTKLKSKKASFGQSFGLLFLAVAILLSIRWALIEPFIIPSGSMIPELLVHDHIFVSKWSFGLRWPFSKQWITQWAAPQRGDVVVFDSVDDDGIYLIKRVIGLPGDEIRVDKEGHVLVNGQRFPIEKLGGLSSQQPEWVQVFGNGWPSSTEYDKFQEKVGEHSHRIFLKRDIHFEWGPVKVPPDSFFVMGDNRDHSNDSRYWGTVPSKNLVGRALFIWYSCSDTIPQSQVICDPRTTRWQRLFTRIP